MMPSVFFRLLEGLISRRCKLSLGIIKGVFGFVWWWWFISLYKELTSSLLVWEKFSTISLSWSSSMPRKESTLWLLNNLLSGKGVPFISIITLSTVSSRRLNSPYHPWIPPPFCESFLRLTCKSLNIMSVLLTSLLLEVLISLICVLYVSRLNLVFFFTSQGRHSKVMGVNCGCRKYRLKLSDC